MKDMKTETNIIQDALANAAASDIEFAAEALALHPDSNEAKTGYRPIAVNGVLLPPGLPVVYVHARDQEGDYWYVLVKIGQADTKERAVPSEHEARIEVLDALKRLYEATANTLKRSGAAGSTEPENKG